MTLSPFPRAAPAPVSAGTATLVLIVVTAVLRTLAGGAAGLCYGESYYFSGALRPSPGYFDQPPLSLLLGTLGLAAAGGASRLAVRWPFILLFAGTTWLLFLLGRKLFSPWAGFLAALLMNLTPLFSLSVGIFLQPEGPLMFFTLACVWCLAQVLLAPTAGKPYLWWSAAGAMLGLAILSKYSAGLLAVGAGLYILTRPDQRRWLTHPAPWLGAALAAVLFTPVIVWNAGHGWISFLWQGRRGAFQGLHLDWLLQNLAGQALELLPWIWAGLVIELVRGFRSSAQPPARRFLAWMAVTPVVLFSALAAWAPIGNHFHWGSAGYLLLFLPLGDTVLRRLREGAAGPRWRLAASVVAATTIMTVLVTHTATGWLRAATPGWLAGTVAGLDDPTVECVDYEALAGALGKRELLGQPDVFVFSDRWYRAGKVDFALGGQMPVLAFHPTDPRSFAFYDRSERWLGKDGILVTTRRRPAEVNAAYGQYFRRLSFLGEVPVGRHGREEVVLYLYRGEALQRPYPRPYG